MTLTVPIETQPQPRLLYDAPGDAETPAWLNRIEPVLAAIDDARASTERDRQSPRSVHEELVRAGVPRMWVSRAYGGSQVSVTTGARVLMAIAERDPSISWQMGVQGAIGRLSDYLPPDAAAEIFAGHDDLVIGSVNPTGTASRTPDGDYVLSGRWSFASGSAHSAWFVAAARVVDASGAPVIRADGSAEIVHLFVRREQITLHDTWHTLGLRGTGSNDYTIDAVTVPSAHVVANDELFVPPPSRPERAYPIAYHDFGPFTSSATALGIAADALAAFKELAGTKTPAGGSSTLARSHTAQDRLARAEADLLCARTAFFYAAERVPLQGETGGDALTALVRIVAATSADRAKAIVNVVNELAGASSVYTTSRLERCFRDIHTATKHITVSPTNFEMVGQYLLGGPLVMRR